MMRAGLTAAWFLLAAAGALWAQDEGDSGGGSGGIDPIDAFLLDRGNADAPKAVALDYLDEEGKAALQRALTEYYTYHETGFRHRRAVFDWQLLSSQIIFGVVIFLVLVGLYFSWLQFMAATAPEAPARKAEAEAGEKEAAEAAAEPPARKPSLATTLEAGLQGVKVSSPVLGIVILVISLAFFYLYLTHVYPIDELF